MAPVCIEILGHAGVVSSFGGGSFMRKDAPALKVFQRIKNQAKTNLNELCDFWNIYEKQLFFVSAIAIYDRYFIEQLSQNSKKSFYDRIV